MIPGPSSGNPANSFDLAGAVSFALDKYSQKTDDMLPAKVLAYNRGTNRAKVIAFIPFVTTVNEQIQRAIVASVPVLQLGGGGFCVSFPLQAGDIGWLKANDRDISLFKKVLNFAAPPTQRKHSFEDAMFIPDTMNNGVSIIGEDASNLVIQNLSGTVKIAWWSTFLKIVSPRVGIGGTPDANVLLDLISTTKAFRLPRMTTGQRDAIPSPQEGMMIWNLTTHGISTYNGSIWS